MKKSTWIIPLFSIAFSTLVSCSDGNMEVYVGTEIEQNEALKELASLKIKSQLNDEDEYYPFVKDMAFAGNPSYVKGGIINIVTGLELNSGYYRYVDLGLSVNWSATDFNRPLGSNNSLPVPSFDTFYQKATEDIEPVAFPGFKQSEIKYPTIMSYEEYVKQMGGQTLTMESIKKYKDYVRLMNNAYSEAVNEYNSRCTGIILSMDKNGSRYVWGAINAEKDACSDAGSPQNIAGNPQYDIATKYIGEGWRVPTRAEWQELIDKCKWEKNDGFYVITGPSGKSILLPISSGNYYYKRTYCTSERSDKMDSSNNKYDIYQFDLDKRQIIQRAASEFYEGYSFVRPVHTK